MSWWRMGISRRCRRSAAGYDGRIPDMAALGRAPVRAIRARRVARKGVCCHVSGGATRRLAFTVIQIRFELPQRLKGNEQRRIIRGGCRQPEVDKAATAMGSRASVPARPAGYPCALAELSCAGPWAVIEDDGNESGVERGGGGFRAGRGLAGMGPKPERRQRGASAAGDVVAATIKFRRSKFGRAGGAACQSYAWLSSADVTPCSSGG